MFAGYLAEQRDNLPEGLFELLDDRRVRTPGAAALERDYGFYAVFFCNEKNRSIMEALSDFRVDVDSIWNFIHLAMYDIFAGGDAVTLWNSVDSFREGVPSFQTAGLREHCERRIVPLLERCYQMSTEKR